MSIESDYDPDLAQAVRNLLPRMEVIDRALKTIAQMPAYDECTSSQDARIAAMRREVDDHISAIRSRESRLGYERGALSGILRAELNNRARRGRGQPRRATSRTLMDEVTATNARESAAHVALTAAQEEVRVATAARVEAEAAYRTYTAGRAA